MNSYFKNYALLVFFSLLPIPAFAMESGNSPSQAKFIAQFALTYLPKKEVISKNNLLLQQNEKDAQDWFNEGTKPENQPIDPLLNRLIKYGPYEIPKLYKLDQDPISGRKKLLLPQSNMQKEIATKNYKKFETRNDIPHKRPPLNTSELVSPVDGRKELLPQRMERQNCLIM